MNFCTVRDSSFDYYSSYAILRAPNELSGMVDKVGVNTMQTVSKAALSTVDLLLEGPYCGMAFTQSSAEPSIAFSIFCQHGAQTSSKKRELLLV